MVEVSVDTVRRMAEIAQLQIPEEDLEQVRELLQAYRQVFEPIERLDLTGVDPVLTMDPRWTR